MLRMWSACTSISRTCLAGHGQHLSPSVIQAVTLFGILAQDMLLYLQDSLLTSVKHFGTLPTATMSKGQHQHQSLHSPLLWIPCKRQTCPAAFHHSRDLKSLPGSLPGSTFNPCLSQKAVKLVLQAHPPFPLEVMMLESCRQALAASASLPWP